MKDIAIREINKQLKRLVALTIMGSLLLVSIFSVSAFSKKVTILDGDNAMYIVTMNTDTHKILEQANLALQADDLIFRIDNPDNSTEIFIKRAFDISVAFDDKIIPLRFAIGTVSDAVKSSGVAINEADYISPDLHTSLEDNMKISIERRKRITITADGRVKEYSVPEGNVYDSLTFLEIPIYENDIINVEPSSDVYDGMQISIDRIGYRNKITTKEVPYKTNKKYVSYLDQGTTQVSVKGINGESEVVIKETLKDGEVVNSEEIKNKITIEPIDEVILVGTKKKDQTIQVSSVKSSKNSGNKLIKDDNFGSITDHRGSVIKYSKVLTGSGTAYTANPGAITSTGTAPRYGTVAVNPNIIPYGTKMYIVSTDGFIYGYATASDTGGALRQGTALVDLYMNSTQECYSFGRRNVKVYILN